MISSQPSFLLVLSISIFLKVYDVSSFIARHPGGAEQLMLGAGRDVTQLFESYHPFSAFKSVLSIYITNKVLYTE